MAGIDGANEVKKALISDLWIDKDGNLTGVRTKYEDENGKRTVRVIREGHGGFVSAYTEGGYDGGTLVLTDADKKLLAHAKDIAQKMMSSVWTKDQCEQGETEGKKYVLCRDGDLGLLMDDSNLDGNLDFSGRHYFGSDELGIAVIFSSDIEGFMHLYDGEKQTQKTEEAK